MSRLKIKSVNQKHILIVKIVKEKNITKVKNVLSNLLAIDIRIIFGDKKKIK